MKNIAVYNPTLNNYTGDIINPSMVLEKVANNDNENDNNSDTNSNDYNPRIRKNNIYMGNRRSKQNDNAPHDLHSLINSLNLEIETEIENQLKSNDIPKENQLEKIEAEQSQKNLEDLKTYRKSQVLRLNDESSKYLKKRKRYKNLAMNKTEPNIFVEAMKPNNIDVNNKSKNEPKEQKPLINKQEILISEINRPFSIMLRGADIIPLLNSTEYESKLFTTVLLIKFELFSSNVSLCPPKQIRWKTTTKVQNPVFNKRIYFDINYSQLPVISSLIIKIKFLKYDKNKEVIKNDTIFWCNYSLFDPNNKLKVGLHKINMHDREVSDDIYYLFNDNPNDKESSKIYIEIENFSKPVINKIQKTEKKDNEINVSILPIEQDFIMKITKIQEKSPFDDLNNYEKETLWRNRFSVAKINSLVPKLFISYDKNSPTINQDLESIVSEISNLSVVQAI